MTIKSIMSSDQGLIDFYRRWIRRLQEEGRRHIQRIMELEEIIRNLKTSDESYRQVSTRDVVRNLCLNSTTICTIDPETNEPRLEFGGVSPAKSLEKKLLLNANHLAHWASIEHSYLAIDTYLESTKKNWLKHAQGEMHQRLIKDLTLQNAQKLILGAHPQEYQEMSGTEPATDFSWLHEHTLQSLDAQKTFADFRL
ncbi:MAG: hypothetical protein Q9179_006286 [Wetmoreana sp. 5 TL-2023]